MLKELRLKLYSEKFAGVSAADFSDLAQGCKTYDEFINKMSKADGGALDYLGLLLWGDKKQINKLSGHLPLLR